MSNYSGSSDTPERLEEGSVILILIKVSYRTLVYLEGDASMDVYEKDGQTRSSLNLIQTKVDVLKRPQPREEASA